MSLENYLLEQLVLEAQPLVKGQLVGKIQQPGSLEFIVGLRRSDNLNIYFSLLPARPAFFITNKFTKTTSSEESPNHLTNFMRKYFTGATLIDLIKEPYERRIIVNFSSFDITGKLLKLSLLLDLMGRSANAHIFVDSVLLASLRELPEDSPNVSLLPLPQKNTIFLQDITENKFLELLKSNDLTTITKQIAGFSPTLVRELEAKAKKMPSYQALEALVKQLASENSPQIYAPEKLSELKIGKVELKSNLLLTYINLEIAQNLTPTRFSSLNKATEAYFALLQALEKFQTRRNALRTKIKTEITKLESLKSKLRVEQNEFLDSEKYRSFGDLILANLNTLRLDSGQLFLIDYFDPEQKEISLPIAENESPKQLAEQYFKRYQRGKRGQQAIEKRLLTIEKELFTKNQLLTSILNALTEIDLDNIEKPFAPPKIKSTKKSSSKADSLLGGLRRYVSSEGYEILVGRSDKSNEQLTFQIAKAQDIWLHTADYPGSHVVIRNLQKSPIPQRTIYEAAQLAAYFSKAREETNAAVRYTERKNVSRPKKAKTGMVFLTDFKTIMVNPQESGSRLL